LSCFFD